MMRLRSGCKMARDGWNGKGMWIALQRPDANSKMTLPYLYMYTADGQRVPWLASQTDILADDWRLWTKVKLTSAYQSSIEALHGTSNITEGEKNRRAMAMLRLLDQANVQWTGPLSPDRRFIPNRRQIRNQLGHFDRRNNQGRRLGNQQARHDHERRNKQDRAGKYDRRENFGRRERERRNFVRRLPTGDRRGS